MTDHDPEPWDEGEEFPFTQPITEPLNFRDLHAVGGGLRALARLRRQLEADEAAAKTELDRVRAWIVDARTVIDVQSEVTPSPADVAPPVLLDLRIVQRIHVR